MQIQPDYSHQLEEMRRVVYLDLLRIFQRIDDAMNNRQLSVPDQFWIQQEQLKRDMKFDGETYLKGHQDIFMQLPERQAAEGLYELYHLILDESAADSLVHQWVVVNGVLANLVKRELRYITKFLGSAEAEELIKKLRVRGYSVAGIDDYQGRLNNGPALIHLLWKGATLFGIVILTTFFFWVYKWISKRMR